ncbi:unnamed protein product [Closterium sp. NIES-53]
MHNGASRPNRLRAPASVRTIVFYGATLDSRFAAALAHSRPAVLAGRLSAVLARFLYTTLAGGRPCCAIAVIVTMVDPVANAGVADSLEARLADVRKRHADGEYGTIPLLIVELGIRSQWATEHPSRPVSPRPVQNEGASAAVDGGCRHLVCCRRWLTSLSSTKRWRALGDDACDGGRDCTDVWLLQVLAGPDHRRTATRSTGPHHLEGAIESQLEVAELKGFADGTVPIPPVDDVELRGEFRAAQLVTFMVISRCCLPVVQLALRSCRERLDAGHQAWHFILSTYQVRDDLYIRQLEEKMTHFRMGEQESAMDYCNRARRILAEMRMAGAEYSTTSYISHIVKGLPHGYNLMKRMMMLPGTHESLDEDSVTGYILQDEAMQEAEQPTELPPQANYAASTKVNQQQGQRGRPGGGGSGGGRSTNDVNEKSDEDDTKGGRGRSTSRRPRRDVKLRKEKQTSRKTSSMKDVDNSSGKSRGDGEASCSMVGVVEPMVSLAPEAGEDFQAVAAAVQENPMAVLLDSGCSHHLMGTKAVFVDMAPSDNVKHLKESGVQLQGDGDETLLVAVIGEVLGRGRYNGRVLCTDLRPCSTRSSSTEVVAQRTIVLATKSTPDWLHARLTHVGVDTVMSSAKHEVATRLNIKPSTGAYSPCVSCVGGKLARHTFPDKGSDAEEALTVVHIELCGPFWVAAKDGSLYFLLLKDRHIRFVWVMPVAKKSDVLREFQKWLVLVEWQAKKSVLMLRLDRRGEFLEKEFTDFVDGKGIIHDLTCPYTPQRNGMAEREMRTAVKSVWKAKFGLASGRTQAHPPMDTSTATVPLLAEVDEPADEDFVEVLPPPPVLAPPLPDADRPALTSVSATGDEWSLQASPVAPASGIAGGRQGAKLVDQDGKPSMTGEQQTRELVEQEAAAGVQSTGEQQTGRSIRELSKSAGGELLVEGSKLLVEGSMQLVDDLAVDEEGELSAGEESTDIDVVEVLITKPELRRTAAFTTVYDKVDDNLLYDDAKEDEELPELDPDMHADPEHRWDIATMTVKEVLASWKGEAVKAAMEEEICSLIRMGTRELVERPRGVNIMKNRWVLTTKYRIDDTVEREKAKLVVKGFTQVCGANYDETYSPVSSYVTLRNFLSIVAVLDLNLMQLDMKNAFLQRKLDRVLYMAHNGVLLGAGWKKSQVDEALYFKAVDIGVTCWVLVYVDDLLAAASSPAMLKELKELLEVAFELRKISPVVKYLRLEIVRDRPARKLWLHQQGYADKLRRRFIDEEQGGRVAKTPVSVNAYAKLTFDEEEAQEREEEEYRQKVGSLQFAATTTRPDIAFACSKLGSGLTVRSDQHWREVDRCLAYLTDTRDTALEFAYRGAAISWSSSRIKCATLSSIELEYVAAMDAGKEGRRLRFLLAEFKLLDAGKPTIFRVDNKSAITADEGLGLMGNLKHMERRYARLQQLVRRGKFVLKYIQTTEQPADILMKALNFPAFNRCYVAIGQVCRADVGDGNDDVRSRCGALLHGWCGDGVLCVGHRKEPTDAQQCKSAQSSASVRTAVFYGATLDSRSAAAMAHRRPAVLARRLSAVLARLLYATLARGRPCCAVGRPG